MRILIQPLIAVCLTALMMADLQAQVPDTISFQGVITDLDGVPIDTTETIVVRLYKNGVVVWDDKIAAVQVVDGRFDLAIGNGALFDTVAFNKPMELEIKLGTGPESSFSPRTPLRSAPYALGLRGLQVVPAASANDAPDLLGGYSGNTGPREGATIGGGGANTATNDVTGRYGTIAGGLGNSAAEQASVGGGGGNNATGKFASIGGGALNTASGQNATIAGGLFNSAAEGSSVGGGNGNAATGRFASIGGGVGNNVVAKYGTIAGGGPSDSTDAVNTNNRVYDMYGVIGGGAYNRAGTSGSTTDARFATVAGGFRNVAGDWYATVSGGWGNEATNEASTVSGGETNEAKGRFSTVSGGRGNSADTTFATVGGGWGNHAGAHSATIAGGKLNMAKGSSSVVGGGSSNEANGSFSTVSGGTFNDAGLKSTVGGGRSNHARGASSTIAGGGWSEALAVYTTIGGGGPADTTSGATSFGTGNKVYDAYGTIAGGKGNRVGTDDAFNDEAATVGGGAENRALLGFATVAGGEDNTASGKWATIGGGRLNLVQGWDATVPGGLENAARGNRSFAAGHFAKANHDYTFVWNGNIVDSLVSTSSNQFLIGAAGGVGINTNAPGNQLHVVDQINANSTSLSSYVAQVQNTSTGQSADGLAIKLNVAASNSGNDFLGFFDGSGLVGSIQGDGTGVTFQTSGSDYAEYIRRENPGDSFEVGDIVGVFNGRVTAQIGPQHRAMVVTGHPSILGNMPPGRENAPEYEKIAFIGQIPVNVVGPVEAGDYIIPSQDGDGFGVAVRTSDLGLAGLEHIVGRAWESNPDPGRKKVLIEVGLDHSAATASLFRKQQAEIDSLREIVQKLVAALGTD